ncbi:phospholipase B1, membrane-associated [Gopherus evgoodei]|uniref:phospholipase B1, membrane-associated n=1 Tax=Gopherus evgoodei TaxID=1825980 RepID=UPI0011CF9B99|nr:phospholipase B1, membrane-associated [Gopherus evgoodei]
MKLLSELFFLWLLSLKGTVAHPLMESNYLREQKNLEPLRRFQFACELEKLSHSPSSSVHTLRPSDIKAIAAIGILQTTPDSRTDHEDLLQSPERTLLQASMGTLSALVSRFNPSVLHQPLPLKTSGAASGTKAISILDQAKEMVKCMKENQMIDFQKDWKLITVFFSAENLCSSCASTHQENCSLDSMERLTRVLDFLYQKVPKAFVNLVDSTEFRIFYLSHSDENKIRAPCNCVDEDSKLDDIILRWSYQSDLEKLLNSGRYDVRDDFTIVLQPFLQEINLPHRMGWQVNGTSIPKTREEITEEKCSALGVGLWNNMVEPVGQKEHYHYAKMLQAQCPSQEYPYLFTYKNSNYSSSSRTSEPEALSQERSYGTSIPCFDRNPSNTVPVSVHNLRPADIKVIGALGDSLTAGNGAGSKPNDVLDVLTQYRGLSWSIGGDENITTVTTLANILREFNPSLQGFSIGKGNQDSSNAFLNQAVAGARSENVPSQARRLVDLMKNDTRINFQEDWKLITLFIGGNDLCRFCDDPVHFSPDNFTNNIRIALDVLHREVPRAFVNLVTVLHIVTLRDVYQEKDVSCPRLIMRQLCPCVLNYDDNSTEIKMLESFNRRYQEETHRLVESGRYDTKEDFTVVVQPFLQRVTVPKTEEGLPDSSYFAPDCFHFHQKTHSQAARALWNSMLEPLGNKTDAHFLETAITLKCPSQTESFLRTYRNSNYMYPNQTMPDVTTPLPSSATPTPAQEPDQNHGSQLLCEDRAPSSSSPTSVHALKPADVRVIAALGDSLTAGNGIGAEPNNILDMNTEYRGLAWSIGGDASLKNVTTLPNILREFNLNLTGYSTGTGGASEPNAFLNQAVPGAVAEKLPDQVRALVRLMKSDPRIDFNTDWKIITVLIGANDLCNYCKDPNYYSAVNFTSHIQEALDILHAEVPRALVNLVEVMDLLPLRQMFLDNQVQCPTHLTEDLCSCVLPVTEGSQELVMVMEATRAYQNSTRKLVESGRYDTQENFTVVLQPFFRNTKIPLLQDGRADMSFLAPDCFHLSQKSQSQLSRTLWNTMLLPVGEKTDFFDPKANITLSCPTPHKPFLGTYRNSNYTPLEPTNKPIQNWGSDLSCPAQTPSESVPTSVHKLRPTDIKIIAALGDSLTTAVGAKATSVNDLQTAWRGLSWSIGGDGTLETHTTLPNILKKFNPELFGFSTGIEKETAGFNSAVGGAKANNMSTQARELVELMRGSSKINFKEDWKLITLFIGGNDLCHYCLDRETYSVENYVKHLQDTLDILYRELPRAFVNLVEIMEIAGLRQIERETSECLVPGTTLCPCFLTPQESSPELQETKIMNKDFQIKSMLMANTGRYAQREDFTVVVQPFFRNTIIPLDNNGKPDLSFFSMDCFHFTERGHAEMAIALWNNMLEPVGQKQSYNNFTHGRSKLKCPTPEYPFLFTSRNSGLQNTTPAVGAGDPLVPYWAVILAAIAGVLVGSVLIGVLMSRRLKKHQHERDKATEVNLTAL